MVARVLVPWFPSWRNTILSPPTGDHEGPPNPSSTTLAPTDRPASCLTSRLSLMPIGCNELRPPWQSMHPTGHHEWHPDACLSEMY